MHKKIIGLFDKTEKKKALIKTKKNKTPPGKKSTKEGLLA